ncbi:HNH endonuclease [Corallococcus sp. AS-1-12]|uniref:HNH endonuclease n=1 Tax=Corallococcus sp. AS-1-12 TaxID=2874598 RepID=UPI001CC0BE98|nr:HNH endonuclease [Corallococcus sp. AS-1-12]MBZ4335080.1 HNH endonuclease [Corallococcus sp. AS-1-12]
MRVDIAGASIFRLGMLTERMRSRVLRVLCMLRKFGKLLMGLFPWVRSRNGRPGSVVPVFGTNEECPYCTVALRDVDFGGDHIFPEFMGGSKKVPACDVCNHGFGGAFEGVVARQFQMLDVFLAANGLRPKHPIRTWSRAYTYDGLPYDLVPLEDGRLRPELSHTVIEERDADGVVRKATFKSRREAKGFERKLSAKGWKVVIEYEPGVPHEVADLGVGLTFGSEMQELALKICLSACTGLVGLEHERLSAARRVLCGEPPEEPIVFLDFSERAEIDARRKPLSHVVYVEQTPQRVYGVVQFYGSFQYYCYLSDAPGAARSSALIGCLDVLTGDERFELLRPLDLSGAPSGLECSRPEEPYVELLSRFEEQAKQRGASHLDLSLTNLTFGATEESKGRQEDDGS